MQRPRLTLPFEYGGIVYDVFREEHRDAGIANLVQEFALNETMNRAVGLTAEEFRPFAEALCDDAVKDQLSVVATEMNTGEFIAPLFSQKYSNNFLDGPDIPRLRPIMTLLGDLATMFEKAHPQSLEQRILYLNIVAIPAAHRGRGVGQFLWFASLVRGWNLGFTLAAGAVTDGPSGPNSRHCLHKMRFTKNCEISYRDFEYEGERVFAGRTAFESAFFATRELRSEQDLWELVGDRPPRVLTVAEAEAFGRRPFAGLTVPPSYMFAEHPTPPRPTADLQNNQDPAAPAFRQDVELRVPLVEALTLDAVDLEPDEHS